jgi:hypothetical protein
VDFNGEAFSSFESAPKGGEMVVRRFQERRGELDRVAWHASASSGGATWLRCGYDDRGRKMLGERAGNGPKAEWAGALMGRVKKNKKKRKMETRLGCKVY